MDPKQEIRILPISVRSKLSSILEVNDAWKLLMGIIPSQINANVSSDQPKMKYCSEQVQIIEDEAKRQKKPAFDILIDEWGTSGKQRPRICDLIQLLAKIELYHAADFLSEQLLEKGPIPRPSNGPGAPITLDGDTNMFQSEQINAPADVFLEAKNLHIAHKSPAFEMREYSDIAPVDDFDTPLPRLSYAQLEFITDNFNLNLLAQNGRKLGAGAFGTVFLGKLPSTRIDNIFGIELYKLLKLPLHTIVAVKRLDSKKAVDMAVDTNRLFKMEVETMSRYNHENLLTLLAYSANGPDCCLVYPFMPNGSLEARLACEGGSLPLQWNQRLDVTHGVAAALIYLHTSGSQPLVHRDVKSANILLDQDMKPKLGDFGLIRAGASGATKSMALTSNVLGTSAYMAPEAFRGDISVKLDTFSFGVIILELLTGLPPYDEDRDGNDLISHVDAALDEKEIVQLLDPKIPPLPEEMSKALHSIALACFEEKKRRPLMEQVYRDLLQIDSQKLISL